jgi:hypothetical protein
LIQPFVGIGQTLAFVEHPPDGHFPTLCTPVQTPILHRKPRIFAGITKADRALPGPARNRPLQVGTARNLQKAAVRGGVGHLPAGSRPGESALGTRIAVLCRKTTKRPPTRGFLS